MKKILILAIASLMLPLTVARAGVDTSGENGHPRLFVSDGEDFKKIDEVVKGSEMLQTIQTYIFKISDESLKKAPNVRKMKGKRLLNVSVDCFTKIFHLTYAYRVSGNIQYAKRAIEEMKAVAAFQDWNPSHFLDVSEMMCGMAIGYDWLYHIMTPSEREIIRNALIEKGLKPCLDEGYCAHWLGSSSNWNQVCNCGSTLAAIAVIETNPEFAEIIIPRAVKTLEKPMSQYRPDGAYREGPGYWCYGTAYNCLFLAAVEKYYGQDFGLIEKFPVFLKTVDYHLAMMTPTYEVFCYADQAFPAQVSIAPFYLYDKTGDNTYLYMLQRLLKDVPLELARCRHQRTLPAALVFAGLSGRPLDNIEEPKSLAYIAGGRTPVAAFRSSWKDKDALYLGLKCGSPKEGHNHMDEGSFYIEAKGVRWAVDLGGENYSNLEKAGADLWGSGQDAGRWRILRTGLWGHNCLIMNSHDLIVDGYCKVEKSGTDPMNMWAETDLTSLYGDDAKSVVRRVSLIDKSYFVIEDRIVTGAKSVKLRWQMATEAVKMSAKKNTAQLVSSDGKTMDIVAESNSKISFHKWSAEPFAEYETPNPGRKFVGYTTSLKANKEYTIKIKLIP